MRILGYGEDSLTYWALSRHLPEVIGPPPLNDDSTKNDKHLLIYRPSFGRAGGMRSAPFGEFDAIIGTSKAVYLVESKWTRRQIAIARRQILRHQIFRWIRERWREQQPADWPHFHRQNSADFEAFFNGKPLAPPQSRLASNLQFILRQLNEFGSCTTDVLLYFYLEDMQLPEGLVAPDGFAMVPFPYQTLNPPGVIIDMQA